MRIFDLEIEAEFKRVKLGAGVPSLSKKITEHPRHVQSSRSGLVPTSVRNKKVSCQMTMELVGLQVYSFVLLRLTKEYVK